jgi:YYY domain-containing protein
MRYSSSSKKIFKTNSDQKRRLINSLLIITGFVLVSYFLFFPFSKWYGQGYSTIQPWKGERTPIGSFITHWGFFIFIIYSYLLFEIKRWMEITPLISLKKYYQHRRLFAILLIFLLGITAILFFTGIEIVSILLPGIVISSLLIIVKAKSDELKFVLSIVLVGLIIVLGVELVVLQGDIGRMNTVFKFYLQAWTFLSLGSAILLSELSESRLIKSHESACRFWRGILMMLTFSVILFPITATVDKINDRISHNTPITLDGLEYMKYSSYSEGEEVMDLEQDYQAIRWMQESIIGTPVIMEANTPEYRWGNRISIYTGLPSIVGWNWHQRQQRSINPGEWVFKRVEDVTTFYDALDVASALEIIKKYQVQYIVVGQLEKALYQEAGIQKFDEFNNRYWKQVFSYKDTKIYQVIG